MTQIKNSVGKGGMNLPVETNYIQRLLNIKLAKVNQGKKISEDGDCGPKTQAAIRDFQQKVLRFAHPDGLIEPGKTTFKKLTDGILQSELTKQWNAAATAENKGLITTGGRVAQAAKTNTSLPAQLVPTTTAIATASATGEYSFPLDAVPSACYQKGDGARYFGAGRNGGGRLHAGCDLIAKPGSPVYAIADGEVRQDLYYFYSGTYALEVKHKKIIARYGELLATQSVNSAVKILPDIKKGAKVKKGQLIGYVGKLVSGSSMLHFEAYGTTVDGKLTLKDKSGGSYKRRSDLLNPTNLLNGAKTSLPEKVDLLDEKLLQLAIKAGYAQKKKAGF